MIRHLKLTGIVDIATGAVGISDGILSWASLVAGILYILTAARGIHAIYVERISAVTQYIVALSVCFVLTIVYGGLQLASSTIAGQEQCDNSIEKIQCLTQWRFALAFAIITIVFSLVCCVTIIIF
jgi:hypothetical protein